MKWAGLETPKCVTVRQRVKRYSSHACLQELACLVENHLLSQITKFVTCSLFRFQDNRSLQQFCGNKQTDRHKLSTVPSAHAGEGNNRHNKDITKI